MDELSDLLNNIKKRPAMYLGSPCPVKLELFIQGWLTGKEDYQKAGWLTDFHQFVAKKHNIRTTHSAGEILVFFCSSNSDAFDEYYKLLEDFQNEIKT